MSVFAKYLETYGGGQDVEKLRTDAAEFLQHGVRSMISEGQNSHDVWQKALPIFGENFLIEAGIVDIVAAEESK